MPNRSKRTFEDFDPNKSDSDDSTYGASAARTVKSKPSRDHPKKPSRKKQRRSYDGNDSEDISEVDQTSEESSVGEVEEEVEVDERTGRPKRKSTKKTVKYEESDGDSEVFLEAADSAAEEGEEAGEVVGTKAKKPRSLVLKLTVRTPQPTPGPTTRSTRTRSASHGAKRRPTPEPQLAGTRRSSRIAHDDQETMVALTGSGHHAEIVRPGTRSPEGIPARAFKGGKGLKALPPSAIVEEEEDSSARTKDERADDTRHDTSASNGIREIAASVHDDAGDEVEGAVDNIRLRPKSDTQNATQGDTQLEQDVEMGEEVIVPESDGEVAPDDDDEDEDPISQRRNTRHSGDSRRGSRAEEPTGRTGGRSLRGAVRSSREQRPTRSSQRHKKGGQEENSDFEPAVEEGAEDELSSSEASQSSPRKGSQRADEDDSSNGRRSGRVPRGKSRTQQGPPSDEHDSEVAEELAEELEDLRQDRPRRAPRAEIIYDDKPKRRSRKSVDYRILRPDLTLPVEDPEPASNTTPSRRGRGGGGGTWQRSLFSTYGPFGGAGGPPPVFGGPGGIGAAGGVDSDSSDEEIMQRPRGVGTVGMTPTSAVPTGFGLFPPAQAHNADPQQGHSATPANLGKIKDKHALADADPLGVDQNVNFDSVGGLQGHIDQLKEMVALPLLYPEIFQRFHVTPPRGVLFHGPPGTGKTLLARALASSVSSQSRKVTFYMRKGADALSKWVGEAERQLRLLFEEARKTQPSIIFFDEIDGTFNASAILRAL